jgi:hypothetical protein
MVPPLLPASNTQRIGLDQLAPVVVAKKQN